MNNGKAFEKSVKKMIEQIGFQITRQPQPSCDGGVDMIASHPSPVGATSWIIQCKDATSVGRTVVDQLVGTMAREKGHVGLIVTTGRFTKDAEQAAKDHGCIKLIAGPKYQSIITPSHIQKTTALETNLCHIKRNTIKNIINIVEQEEAPMTIAITTPTIIPKYLKKMVHKAGGSVHFTKKPQKEDPGKLYTTG